MKCGLEIHVQLETKSKLFCNCPTNYKEAPANTNICPVCLNQPGAKPFPTNEKALENALMISLMLNCKIEKGIAYFMRKHYDYPDLPSGYQRTSIPIGYEGELNGVRIREIHMEEDAGKLIHDDSNGLTYVDYNRAGVPLIEIVSEPDMRSADEVIAYLEKLRETIQYLGASDCKLNEGSMRADVNLSIREKGSEEFGTRTESKNLNSFRAIRNCIENEIA